MIGREFFTRTNKRAVLFLSQATEKPEKGRPSWRRVGLKRGCQEAEFPLANWVRVWIAAVLDSFSLAFVPSRLQLYRQQWKERQSELKGTLSGEKGNAGKKRPHEHHLLWGSFRPPVCLLCLISSLFWWLLVNQVGSVSVERHKEYLKKNILT